MHKCDQNGSDGVRSNLFHLPAQPTIIIMTDNDRRPCGYIRKSHHAQVRSNLSCTSAWCVFLIYPHGLPNLKRKENRLNGACPAPPSKTSSHLLIEEKIPFPFFYHRFARIRKMVSRLNEYVLTSTPYPSSCPSRVDSTAASSPS